MAAAVRILCETKMAAPQWENEKTVMFIDALRCIPALWDSTCKEYRDKRQKDGELRKLAAMFATTPIEVIKKIRNLRSQFLREHKRILEKKSAGTYSTRDACWFGYEPLKFLVSSRGAPDFMFPMEEGSCDMAWDVDEEPVAAATQWEEPVEQSQPVQQVWSVMEEQPPVQAAHVTMQEECIAPPRSGNRFQLLMRAKKKSEERKRLLDTYRRLKGSSDGTTKKDEFAVFAEHVANKLRKGRTDLEISVAQYHINTILFQLEMGMYAQPYQQSLQTMAPQTQLWQNRAAGQMDHDNSQIIPDPHQGCSQSQGYSFEAEATPTTTSSNSVPTDTQQCDVFPIKLSPVS